MHKMLLLLGLLLNGPRYGYELHQIVRAHGELYADLKKANIYYLLERLATEGYLRVEVEIGARGSRGERLIYELTEQGREQFTTLLHEVMLSYEPIHMGIDTAVVFLSYLSSTEGLQLLKQRRQIVAERRAEMSAELNTSKTTNPLVHIASDHLLSLVDAELAWIDRSVTYLIGVGWADKQEERIQHIVNGGGEQELS